MTINWPLALFLDFSGTNVTGRLDSSWRRCCKRLRSLKLANTQDTWCWKWRFFTRCFWGLNLHKQCQICLEVSSFLWLKDGCCFKRTLWPGWSLESLTVRQAYGPQVKFVPLVHVKSPQWLPALTKLDLSGSPLCLGQWLRAATL